MEKHTLAEALTMLDAEKTGAFAVDLDKMVAGQTRVEDNGAWHQCLKAGIFVAA